MMSELGWFECVDSAFIIPQSALVFLTWGDLVADAPNLTGVCK
jgi:hypothetical protein